MRKKNVRKLSNATVATMMVASSAIVATPSASAAPIKDLNKDADYYQPVLEMIAKGIVKGYPDGTFRPNKNVTRGQAAKMIALSLGLETDPKKVKNPGFKDIPVTHDFYGYIAALANAGIISGYQYKEQKTYRAGEPVTRGQMSKFIVNGYGFKAATKTNNYFKDVSKNNEQRFNIQTLFDLEITKGTTPTTYSPGKPVTRGQLASFIARANKVKAVAPYTITEIAGDKVFINSVPYRIDRSLQAILNDSNKAILKGAVIEGAFNERMLTKLTKLTIHASGTAAKPLTFNGNNTTFAGNVDIIGSYVCLQNWTFNGVVTIKETPRTALAKYARSYIPTDATKSFIDWGAPTDTGKDHLNPSDKNELKPSPSPSAGVYNARMPKILKHVDFTNSVVKDLRIEQNQTYIKASKTLPKVSILRDVEQVEIHANMTSLTIQNARHLDIFGVHAITTAYKNSSHDVFFNTKSRIQKLVVGNAKGYIDIGQHVTIDQAILPKDKTPIDIFDDYKNDIDRIGVIKDPSGELVDRNPNEGVVVVDVTPPKIERLSVVGESFTAKVTLKTNEDGRYHYAVVERGAKEPSTRQILEGHGINGNGQWKANIEDQFTVRNLTSEKQYDLYLVFVDAAGNISAKQKKQFVTTDGTPPLVKNLKLTPLVGGQRMDFTFKPSEQGTYFYYYEKANAATNHSIDYIMAKAEEGKNGGKGTTGTVTATTTITKRLTNLAPNSKYVLYVVMIDKSGNKTKAVATTSNTTTILDVTNPYVTGKTTEDRKLVPNTPATSDVNVLTEFYIYFNEELNKETAENVNNYKLSGTGIVNVPGQVAIKPSQAIYSKHGKGSKVLLKIPSLTGFVDGDTLKVEVLPAVKDLADLPFISSATAGQGNPVYNYAEYQHVDKIEPVIKEMNIKYIEQQNQSNIEYTTTKAGSLYYMILPEDTNFEALGITSREFVDEFGKKPSGKFTVGGKKIYLEGATLQGLMAPRTAVVGKQSFVYDLRAVLAQADLAKSYRLYAVLRDRAGNLSPIQSSLIISDRQAPVIGSYHFESQRKTSTESADDKKAKISIESDEKGTVHYKALEKYVKDSRDPSKYVLNPLIYDEKGNFKELTGTANGTNEQREEAFRKALNGVSTASMSPGTLTSINHTFNEAHKEYVVVMAAKDTYGNFTTKDQAGKLMYKELYADGTEPAVVDRLVYRNFDDSFTITFSEMLERKYKADPAQFTSLEQVTDITASTSLNTLLTVKDDAGNDITNEFKIADYTVGKKITDESQLRIELKDSAAEQANRTINVEMKDTVLDQKINKNKGNTFAVEKLGKYVYRDTDLAILRIELVEGSNRGSIDVVFDILGEIGRYEANEILKYYYTVTSLEQTQESVESQSIEEVITTAIKGDKNTLARGEGVVAVTEQRIKLTLHHKAEFSTDWVTLVVQDQYGNRVKLIERVGYKSPNIKQ